MPFDAKQAGDAVRFFECYLKHTKGRFAGTPFLLPPWQAKIIRDIFGTLGPDGFRQYRTAYVEIPRKNGKSEIAAGIALKLLLADGEPGAEIYSAAADKNQAGIVFRVAASMVRKSPALRKRCRIIDSSKTIVVPKTESIYRVLSADGPRQHGLNPSGIIFDEVHTQTELGDGSLWEALTTGSDTRRQPLMFAITTAGIPGESPLWEQLNKEAKAVLHDQTADPHFYAVLYAAGEEDDWTSEATWRKANPAIGDFLDIEKVRADCLKAQRNPVYENTFRRLRLNQRTQQETRYIPIAEWDACTVPLLDLSYARNLATAA
ncbi:MAG TPA: terminase large subunit [Bryobacteraceae bacterium]|nr:terminase large subunit [Bryobacteraceae bacterium]